MPWCQTYQSYTKLRKVGATATALKCDDATRHLISSQMTHTQQIHSQHYELLQGRREAARAHKIRQKLVDSDSDSQPTRKNLSPKKSPKKKPRVPYLLKEVETIKFHFKEWIASKRQPTADEAKSFLERNPMERTSKHIQDKVRQLYS